MLIYTLCNVMFLFSVLSFILNRKHFLLMLMSLEFIVIVMYLNMFMYLSNLNFEFFFLMVFLTFSVCESVIGLSILVNMVRMYSNDYYLSFSFLW